MLCYAAQPGGARDRSVALPSHGYPREALHCTPLRQLTHGLARFSTVLAANSPLLASALAGRRGGMGMEPAYPAITLRYHPHNSCVGTAGCDHGCDVGSERVLGPPRCARSTSVFRLYMHGRTRREHAAHERVQSTGSTWASKHKMEHVSPALPREALSRVPPILSAAPLFPPISLWAGHGTPAGVAAAAATVVSPAARLVAAAVAAAARRRSESRA